MNIRNDLKIQNLIHEDIVSIISKNRGISISEARHIISEMSFAEYNRLLEDNIIPPSGQTIGPGSNNSQSSNSASNNNGNKPASVWPGKGTTPAVGMTVGLSGPNNAPVPGQISQVDLGAKGVKVKNPITNQEEWMNIDNLQPFVANSSGNQQNAQSTQNNQSGVQTTQESEELSRLKELAGINETCSAGATGAGSVAVAVKPMGKMNRRQPTEEEYKKEYTPTGPAKTIIGDTKPNQATGELSANLVANGKRSAKRPFGGLKK